MTDAPTRAAAGARIASGHQRDPHEHVAQRLARAWAYDEGMERLAAMRDDPTKWGAVPQGARLSVGYYSGAKAAAAALGMDTSAPAATP